MFSFLLSLLHLLSGSVRNSILFCWGPGAFQDRNSSSGKIQSRKIINSFKRGNTKKNSRGGKGDNDIALLIPNMYQFMFSRPKSSLCQINVSLEEVIRVLIHWFDAKGYEAIFVSLSSWIAWKIHLTNLGRSFVVVVLMLK